MTAASPQLIATPTPGALNVRVYDNLRALSPSCRSLFEFGAQKSFFLGLAWFQHLAGSVLSESERLHMFVVEDEHGNALLALPATCSMKRSATRPRELSSLANYYSSLYAPIVRGWDEVTLNALRELARYLASDASRWDIVRLNPLAQDEPVFEACVEAFRAAGMAVQKYVCFGNWYLPVAGRSFEQYFETLPSVTRNTVQRKTKKFEKSAGRIEIVTGTDALERSIKAYEQVYQASWKVPEPFPEFVPDFMRLCAAKGWLRLGVAYVHGEPAAAQLWVVHHGKAAIYKLAYDERFSDVSAGSILTAKLMEYVLDVDQVTEVDYLTGDDPYKKQWMSHRRERWGIMAFNPRTLRGCLTMAKNIGGHALKQNYLNLKQAFGHWHSRSSTSSQSGS